MSAADGSSTSRGVHPDDATLQSWVQGALPAESAARLEDHLETCDECARRLEAISSDPDPFLQKLRGAAGLSVTLTGPPNGDNAKTNDANLMFGALALQAGMITPQQLADACVLWSSRGGMPLADLMIEQGWIDESIRNSVMMLLSAKASRDSNRAAAETLSGRDTTGLGLTDTMTLTPLPGERLRLMQLHSQGGIGQVWRAQDTLLGREVALKELLPELRGSKRHRERFFREARVAAQLNHPGTAPVFEYREEGGRCYYTMRFYTGKTLTEAIRQTHANASENGDSASFEQLFPLLEQFLIVCDTVAYAHSKGIIHRDLKGENVVLGEFGEVTVIDWGLAKSIHGKPGSVSLHRDNDEQHPTIEGERLGTPGFMAPEQARGDLSAIDERTDVYGLAAVLYEVLTARPPFTGETANEVMHRVETKPPVRPSALRTNTPEELEEICLKGLSKKQEDRYATAVEFRDAVRHWLSDQLHQRLEADRQAKFFSLSHDIFVALDEKGVVKQVNPAYERFFGYDGAKSPGQHYMKRVHPDDVERAKKLFEDAMRGVAQQDTLFRIQGADGEFRPVNWTLTRIPGESTVYAVGRPVDEQSERRRLSDERSRFFALSPNLFVISDDRGYAAQVNPAWKNLLDWEAEEVVGKPFYSFVHPDDVGPISRAGRRALLRKPVVDLDVRMRCKDGSYKMFAWTLSRVPGERINYAIGRLVAENARP